MDQKTKPNFWALTPFDHIFKYLPDRLYHHGRFLQNADHRGISRLFRCGRGHLFRGKLHKRIDLFCKGAANSNIMLMVWILSLPGHLPKRQKAVGAVDATVNSGFIRTSGQSLTRRDVYCRLLHFTFHGNFCRYDRGTYPRRRRYCRTNRHKHAFHGSHRGRRSHVRDNLSFISDTTIVATRTQGCNMKDKFKVNSLIVIPVAILVTIVYLFQGSEITTTPSATPIEWLKSNSLHSGTNHRLGWRKCHDRTSTRYSLFRYSRDNYRKHSIWEWFAAMGSGISDMGELIIITLLAGGMLEMIRYNGGIAYIIQKLTTHVKSKKGAELSIAALVSFADLCTANNTIALIMSGPIAKDIANRFGIDPRKSASLLDTFSCFMQGIIPYGAQLLMAAGLASITPLAIMQYLYYPYLMGVAALLAIFFRYPRKYSR